MIVGHTLLRSFLPVLTTADILTQAYPSQTVALRPAAGMHVFLEHASRLIGFHLTIACADDRSRGAQTSFWAGVCACMCVVSDPRSTDVAGCCSGSTQRPPCGQCLDELSPPRRALTALRSRAGPVHDKTSPAETRQALLPFASRRSHRWETHASPSTRTPVGDSAGRRTVLVATLRPSPGTVVCLPCRVSRHCGRDIRIEA